MNGSPLSQDDRTEFEAKNDCVGAAPGRKTHVHVLFEILALAIIYALSILFRGLLQPLLDEYGFRQTQTAVSVYWMLRGGPIIAYETPVLGFPWSLPFEFPVYHIIVALVRLCGVPLEPSGRIVSFIFFVGCLWPAYILFKSARIDVTAILCCGILFILSPLYLFWGRTFMIETCAVFFSLCWLAYLARYISQPKPVFLILANLAGVLGILARLPDFLPSPWWVE